MLEKSYDGIRHDLENAIEDCVAKNDENIGLSRANSNLHEKLNNSEALNHSVTADKKRLEDKFVNTSNKNKELRTELSSVKNQIEVASEDLKTSIREKKAIELSLGEEIEELENEVKILSNSKAKITTEAMSLASTITPTNLSKTCPPSVSSSPPIIYFTNSFKMSATRSTSCSASVKEETVSEEGKHDVENNAKKKPLPNTSSKSLRPPWKCDKCEFTTKMGYKFEQLLHKKSHEEEI